MTESKAAANSFVYHNVKTMVFFVNKGEGLKKHQHDYGHLTICYNGSIVIRKEGFEKTFDKFSGVLNLKENEWHEIEALEDNTVFVNIFPKSVEYIK